MFTHMYAKDLKPLLFFTLSEIGNFIIHGIFQDRKDVFVSSRRCGAPAWFRDARILLV